MKYIVVGDIHGDESIIHHLLEKYPHKRLLFIGDFLDSFVFSNDECVRSLNLALDLIEAKYAVGIIGNHELSYVNSKWRCSGYNTITAAKVLPNVSRMTKLLKPFLYSPERRVLFTHAGLTNQLWRKYELTFENLEDKLTEAYRDHDSFFYDVGHRRSGFKLCGGPLWCDWSEFVPVEGLRQVFGHSASLIGRPDNESRFGLLRERGGNWNIDCLQYARHFLEFDEETGTLTPIIPEHKREV